MIFERPSFLFESGLVCINEQSVLFKECLFTFASLLMIRESGLLSKVVRSEIGTEALWFTCPTSRTNHGLSGQLLCFLGFSRVLPEQSR